MKTTNKIHKIKTLRDIVACVNNENAKSLIQEPLNIETHLDFQLIQTQEHLQQLNVKREKSTFLPNIAAFYNHQESNKKQKDKKEKAKIGMGIGRQPLSDRVSHQERVCFGKQSFPEKNTVGINQSCGATQQRKANGL